MNKQYMKKAQGLPLNTIVIALLVVVVLVVIVLAFTTNIAGFNESVNEQGANSCSHTNTAIQTLYGDVEQDQISSRTSCASNEERIPGISGNEEGEVCCYASSDLSGGDPGVGPSGN